MKILKARNGIALMAVLVIMLITSLFIPVMFSMSDTSVSIAVKGTDRQRASYLARSATEMTVAAFKKAESQKDLPADANGDKSVSTEESALYMGRNNFLAKIDKMSNPKNSEYNPYATITSERIYMLSGCDENGNEVSIEYASGTTARDYLIASVAGNENEGVQVVEVEASEGTESTEEDEPEVDHYIEKGYAECTITFDGSVHYYKTHTATNEVEEIFPAKDPEDPMNATDLATRETQYQTALTTLHNSLATGTATYSLSKQENKNLVFTSTATINDSINATRSCTLVMKSEPSKDDWLVFGVPGQPNTGGNQVFVDPTKATSVVPISYEQDWGMQKQPLLVYSCVGNMVIDPANFKDVNGAINDKNNDGRTTVGANNSQLVLGVQPGLNTTPNNDPSSAIIDAVNYYEQKTGEKDENENGVFDPEEDKNANGKMDIGGVQYNNFIAFGATNVIRVGMPINLIVNPCRTGRWGDGSQDNASLYKIMIFQAPVIQFTGRTDMMMSLYDSGDDARRMSSIILAAPESTPYSYYNSNAKYNRTVKAGMVYFDADCYVWVVEYGEDGSPSSSILGQFSETIYKRDSDFKIYKLASAGDVYYFNAEVQQGKCTCTKEKPTDPCLGTCPAASERVGLSLTSYFLETVYKTQYNPKTDWLHIWSSTKKELFAAYLDAQPNTYVPEDLLYLGNVNNPNTIFSSPEIDDYYVVWTS